MIPYFFPFAAFGFAALIATPTMAATPERADAAPVAHGAARALVHAKSTAIWSEPHTGSRKVQTVFAGNAVDVLGTRGEWTHVRSGGHEGWVESNTLEPWGQNR